MAADPEATAAPLVWTSVFGKLAGVGAVRHPQRDAIYIATAQAPGHSLLALRDGIFEAWTQTPIVVI